MKVLITGCDQSTQWIIETISRNPNIEVSEIIPAHMDCSGDSGIKFTTDMFDSITMDKPDIVFFLSSSLVSSGAVLRTLDAGCSVFINNPFQFNPDFLQEICSYAINHDSKLVFGHPYLHDARIQHFIKSNKKSDHANKKRLDISINRNLKLSGLLKYKAPNEISEEYEYAGGVFHKEIYNALFVIYEFTGPVKDFSIQERSRNILPQGISDYLQISIEGSYCNCTLNISISKDLDYRVMSMLDDQDNVLEKIKISDRPYSGLYNILKKSSQRLAGNNITTNVNVSIENQVVDLFLHDKDSATNPEMINKAIDLNELAKKIYSEIKCKRLDLKNRIPDYPSSKIHSHRVLVTGATGALGRTVVKDLINNNYKVRALVRKLSRNTQLLNESIEIFYGDIADLSSLDSAFRDVNFVVHTAADTVATDITKDTSTINGTLNIIQLSKKYNIKKLVYISTCNVYGVSDYASGYHIDEDSPLEKHPEKRGSYTYTKLKAESLVLEEIKQGGINAVCIRPGTYFGENVEYFTPLIGFSYKNRLFITIGHKEQILPLVCIDNVSSAILALLRINVCPSNIYNVIDDDAPTKKEYIDLFVRKLYPRALFFHVPFNILLIIILIQESFFKFIATKPFLTKYRFVSSQNNVIYESKRIHKELDWVPPYTLHDKMNVILERGNVGDKIGNI